MLKLVAIDELNDLVLHDPQYGARIQVNEALGRMLLDDVELGVEEKASDKVDHTLVVSDCWSTRLTLL